MADKKPDNSQFYQRPPKLGNWEAFSIFLWNPETSQFLGRTGASWAKILLFYVLFYAGLIGFFAAMLAVFFQTLDYNTPKWQLESSLIGSNPGLGFRPMPPESNVESTLIWYKHSDKGNVQHWQKELDKFLHIYDRANNPHADKLENCSDFQTPAPGRVCNVIKDRNEWYPCTSDAGYNFESKKGGPCIFLKLNRIFNWTPEYYNSSTIKGLTNEYDALKKRIEAAESQNKHHVVWVTCQGENSADQEHIGPIRYIPQDGFLAHFFPYTNQEGYLSPLVAVHFEKPSRGVIINIECKAWARNIHHDRAERRGSVHFELLVD